MRTAFILGLALAGFSAVYGLGRTCFPDAIPEELWENIMFDGEEMPIRIWENAWASGTISAWIFVILLTEKMGYNATLPPGGGGTTSRPIVFKLAGCPALPNGTRNQVIEDPAVCAQYVRQYHFSLESWHSAYSYLPVYTKDFGLRAAVDLGSIGYAGYDGMFIMGGSLEASLNATGIGLDFYRNWNAQFFNPGLFVKKVSEIDTNQVATCATAVQIGYPDIAQIYVDATGDTDGVETKNGALVLKCYQDKWWISPPCRADPGNCPVLITGTAGWGMIAMIQQAYFHNMPVAFATAWVEPDAYQSLNKATQGLMYWWVPDTQFTLDNPKKMIFPDPSPAEQAQNIWRTMAANLLLSKWAAGGMRKAADRAYTLLENLQISDSDMNGILKLYLAASPPDAWATACQWLLNNEALWSGWVPDERTCLEGKGLVDLNGNFVDSKVAAVGCATCPVGYFSEEMADITGTTRKCSPCPLGTSQPLPGENTCNDCDLGRVASETGSGSCKLCPLGEYANATGMSECYKCGSNTTQMDKWTTAEGVIAQGQETWIQIQGATTEAVCGCVSGTFFWEGLCEPCIEGAICAGSSKLLLEPGYFSTPEDPGSVYRCFSNTIRCPGGEPGTCAFGRDTESVSCSACLPGLHARDGACVECVGGDYALVITFGILAVCCIAVLYLVLMGEGQKSRQPGSLLVAALGMGQMVTIVQQLTVIQQFKIDWGEPFSSILVAMEVMAFDMDMISIGCVAPMDPVSKFTTRTLLVLVFFAVAAIVHFTYLAFKRSRGFQLSLLARTVGTLFMVFFISLCSSLLAPFRCNTHPNGKMTIQTYHGVYCNGRDEHLAMSVVGGLACLLPAGFLAICMWVILVELPKRLQAADVKFIRACSFLFMRFRPGAEVYSVVFLVRNALVVLCPLIPGTSGKVVSMNLLLYASLVMTAFSKPWRAMPCNFLDMALITGMLVILDMGSLFVGEVDGGVTMVICLIFSALMLLSIIAAVGYGITKHFMLKYRKPFRYFLCHQKIQAGSYARLLKMECGKRGGKYYCFVDCDDLNDLTRLFSYVGQDSETFVILGSPDIMTRKWCVGEMVTARSHKVHSVLLMWPDFVKPDKIFIENYDSIVPDITELANYNIGLPEVRETLEWINTIETLDVPALLNPENITGVINGLTGTIRAKSVSHENQSPDCLIISDLDNMEAAATAYILLGLVVSKLMGGQKHNQPTVLQKERSVPKNATAALVICSDGCFKSFQFAEWMLQVAMLEGCCVLPIIAEDGFRFPAQTFYDDLDKISQLETVDLKTYKKCIKAIFQEIAVVFSPQNYSSTAEDLDLRAKQVAWRLNSGQLKSLFQKVQSKDDDEIIENGESNQAKITDLEDSNTLAINFLDAPDRKSVV